MVSSRSPGCTFLPGWAATLVTLGAVGFAPALGEVVLADGERLRADRVVVAASDVTQRVRAELAAREAEELPRQRGAALGR